MFLMVPRHTRQVDRFKKFKAIIGLGIPIAHTTANTGLNISAFSKSGVDGLHAREGIARGSFEAMGGGS